MRKIFLFEEHKRLKRLYLVEVFRTLLLDYLIINESLSMKDAMEFTKYSRNDLAALNSLKEEDFLNQLIYLENLQLVKKNYKTIYITDKGKDFIERGVFYDRIKHLSVEVRNFKVQLLTVILSLLSALASVSLLVLKILGK